MNELYTDNPAAANTNMSIAKRESDAAYGIVKMASKKERKKTICISILDVFILML